MISHVNATTFFLAPAADLLATVLGFGARVLLSDGFQVHDPAPNPAEVRSQAVAGFTDGDSGVLDDRYPENHGIGPVF